MWLCRDLKGLSLGLSDNSGSLLEEALQYLGAYNGILSLDVFPWQGSLDAVSRRPVM